MPAVIDMAPPPALLQSIRAPAKGRISAFLLAAVNSCERVPESGAERVVSQSCSGLVERSRILITQGHMMTLKTLNCKNGAIQCWYFPRRSGMYTCFLKNLSPQDRMVEPR